MIHCIGLHLIDLLGRPVERIPDGQGVVLIDEIRMCVAGTAAATAVGLARLGDRVRSIGCVGDDALGEMLRHRMSEEGVDVTLLATVGGAPTSATILPIRPDGSRPALHVIGATALLTDAHLPGGQLQNGDLVHIGGTFLMPGLDGEPTRRLAAAARESGARVSMDFIPGEHPDVARVLVPVLPYLDYVFPNLEDAAVVAGTGDRAGIARFFHDRGVGCVVLTLGEDGVSIWPAGGDELLLPAYAVNVVDTSGCGDAFAAGFLSALAAGLDLHAAALRGLACGSIVATELGSDGGLTGLTQVEELIAAGRTRPASWQAGLTEEVA